MKITALSNHKPGILNNYIRIDIIIILLLILKCCYKYSCQEMFSFISASNRIEFKLLPQKIVHDSLPCNISVCDLNMRYRIHYFMFSAHLTCIKLELQ